MTKGGVGSGLFVEAPARLPDGHTSDASIAAGSYLSARAHSGLSCVAMLHLFGRGPVDPAHTARVASHEVLRGLSGYRVHEQRIAPGSGFIGRDRKEPKQHDRVPQSPIAKRDRECDGRVARLVLPADESWRGIIDGGKLTIDFYAGALRHNPGKGVLVIRTLPEDSKRIAGKHCTVPTNRGALTILESRGNRLLIGMELGGSFWFEIPGALVTPPNIV